MKFFLSSLLTALVLCISHPVPSPALTIGANQAFQQANASYSRKAYGKAIATYEQLTRQYGFAPGVLYNLANSYAKTGKVGKAIVNYERALKLSPGDSDILGNLELLRRENGLFQRESSFIGKTIHLLDINQWTVLGALALATLTGVLLYAFISRLSRRVLITLCCCCLMVMSLTATGVAVLYRDWQTGIVVDSHTALLISPFPGAETAGNIQEGRQVIPGEHHGRYLHVEEETGRSGWIPSTSLEPIVPR